MAQNPAASVVLEGFSLGFCTIERFAFSRFMRKYIAYDLYLQNKSVEDGRAHDPYRPYNEEIGLIHQWMDQDQKPPESLLSRWFSHPDHRVRDAVVLKARWIDRDLARRIYGFSDWILLSLLAQNPHLTSPVVSDLATWLVEDWDACIRGKHACVTTPWFALFDLLNYQGKKVPADTLRRAYRLAQLPRKLASSLPAGDPLELDPAQVEASFDAFEYFSRRIAEEHPPVPPDVLCQALPYLERYKSVFRNLLRHPDTNDTVLRAALEGSAALSAHDFVARHPTLRWDPEIRPQLLASRDPDVLSALIEDAEPEIAGQLVCRLVDLGFSFFVPPALEARPADRPIVLEAEALLPLLQNADRDLRLTILRSLERFDWGPSKSQTQVIQRPSDSERAEARQNHSMITR